MSDTIEERLARLEAAVANAAQAENVPTHARWSCAACAATLGWVNPVDGVVRVRTAGGVIYLTLGLEGRATSVCHRCAEANVLTGAEVAVARS